MTELLALAARSPSLLHLQNAGFRSLLKHSDLHRYGYVIAVWFNPTTLDSKYEYRPYSTPRKTSLWPRVVVDSYADQLTIHRAIGAPPRHPRRIDDGGLFARIIDREKESTS